MVSDVARRHRGPITYDWRVRFGTAFDPPHSMSWTEVVHLFFQLIRDPSSHTAAAVNGWKHPASREWIALANIFDLHRAINHDKKRGGHFKESPRPWPNPDASKIGGNADQDDIRSALAARGH